MRQMGHTATGFHRVLKVARTIADLANAERIDITHLPALSAGRLTPANIYPMISGGRNLWAT